MMGIAERRVIVSEGGLIALLDPRGTKFLVEAPGAEPVKGTSLKPLETETGTETQTVVKVHDTVILIFAVYIGVEHLRPEVVFLSLNLEAVVRLLLAFLVVTGLSEVIRGGGGETIVLPAAGGISHKRHRLGHSVSASGTGGKVHATVPALLLRHHCLDLLHVKILAV